MLPDSLIRHLTWYTKHDGFVLCLSCFITYKLKDISIYVVLIIVIEN